MFIDLDCDGVHDDCETFSVVGGDQEVGQLLLELVDVFEVGDTCDVLSLICVTFALGHAVISRGVSSMDWADVGSCRRNELQNLTSHILTYLHKLWTNHSNRTEPETRRMYKSHLQSQ